MKIYDIHSHINHNVKGDTKTSVLYDASLAFLKNERLRLNISKMGVSTFSSVLSNENVEEENEYLFDLMNKDKFIYQWVVIDPRNKNTFKQALRMCSHKRVLGIKIHSIYHGYNFLDYADEVFKFASNHGIVVLMHPDSIIEVAKIADNFPNLRLIIAHLGSIEHIEAIKSSKYHNIYTDTSGSLSNQNNVIEYAVQTIGADRILFGTDTYSAAFQLGRIMYAHISLKDKMKILNKNAKKLFADKEF